MIWESASEDAVELASLQPGAAVEYDLTLILADGPRVFYFSSSFYVRTVFNIISSSAVFKLFGKFTFQQRNVHMYKGKRHTIIVIKKSDKPLRVFADQYAEVSAVRHNRAPVLSVFPEASADCKNLFLRQSLCALKIAVSGVEDDAAV